jgi:integrase
MSIQSHLKTLPDISNTERHPAVAETKVCYFDLGYDSAQFYQLMDAAKDELDGKLPDVILFAIHTGASGEEIMKAQWSQIDFERKTFSTTRQKTLRARIIPMNETLTMALQSLSKGAKCISGHIFPVNGMPT